MLSFKLNPIPRQKPLVLFLLIFTHGGFRIPIVAVVLAHFSFLFSFTCASYNFLLINFTKALPVGFLKKFSLDCFIKFFYASNYFLVKVEIIIVLLKICFLFQLISLLIILFFLRYLVYTALP